MNIEKITPQIAALYMGRMCTYQTRALEGAIETPISARVLSDLEDGFATVTPHLRRLESITEEEAKELYRIKYGNYFVEYEPYIELFWKSYIAQYDEAGTLSIGEPEIWLKLLEWGFDLFGLIDSGLAKEIEPKKIS